MAFAKKPVLLTVCLIIAAAVVCSGIGAYLGLRAAKTADPLVGGAMVAMSALLGGALGLVAGALAAWLLPASKLKPASALLGVPALILLFLAARGLWHMDQQTRDPDAAYAGLPEFTATLERDPAFDPVLAPSVTIDAAERRWRVALPDGGSCRGRLRASVQKQVAETLPTQPPGADCKDAPAQGEWVRVSWEVRDGLTGAALLDEACRRSRPQLAQFAAMLSRAPSLADSAASCD